MHAVGCAALGAKDLGIRDQDRRHHFAGRALDLGDRAVAHVGDEGPLAAECNRARSLPHLDVGDHGPVRRLRRRGRRLRLGAGAKDSNGD